MAERSRFWDGVTTGDAAEAPYDAPTEVSQILASLSGARGLENMGAVFYEPDLHSLVPTNPTGQTIRVDTGRAIVYGAWYENSFQIDTVLALPIVGTRTDRFVLRKSWAAQTVRLTRVAGVEGGVAPSLVQTAGVTWDIPICRVAITIIGDITLTDDRQIIAVLPPEVIARGGAPSVATNYVVSLGTGGVGSGSDVIYKTQVSMHNVSVPSRLWPPVSGIYEISFQASSVGGTTPVVTARRNGVTSVMTAGPVGSGIQGRIWTDLATGDYIDFVYTFGGGGSQTLGNIVASLKFVGKM